MSMLRWQLTGCSLVHCSLLFCAHQVIEDILRLFLSLATCALNTSIFCKRWFHPDRQLTSLPRMSCLHSLLIHSFHSILVLNLLYLVHKLCLGILHEFAQLRIPSFWLLKCYFVCYLHWALLHYLWRASCQQSTLTWVFQYPHANRSSKLISGRQTTPNLTNNHSGE